LFGSVVGVAMGGVIATRFGWPVAFVSVGVPGLLLALLYPLVVRDYETVNLVAANADARKMSWREIVKSSLGVRSTIYGYVGGALQLFASAAIVAWIPSYLNRFYALSPEQAAVKAAVVVLVGGIGMAFGGFVTDRMSGADVRNKLRVPGGFAVCSGVLFAAAFAMPTSGLQFGLITAAVLFVGAHMGPVAALAAELNHPGLRATALSVVTLVYNLIGLAPGPFVVGALSDVFGLQKAMMIIPVVCFGAAICFMRGSRYLPEDARRFQSIEGRLNATA